MERDRVEEAIAQLEAEGRAVSANAIVELIGGSKRDVLTHLQALRAPVGLGTGLEEPGDAEEQAAGQLPLLFAARAVYQAVRTRLRSISRLADPLRRQIEALQARQAALTAERARVTSVEGLRALKESLLNIDDELEILTRQYAPLAPQAEAIGKEASRQRAVCEAVRQQALKALEHARREHFSVKENGYNANPQALALCLEVLAEYVGTQDVADYVTRLQWQNELHRHVPPWASVIWVDES